jgi:ABC-type cobalamin/Fe3+-siderophores transport system ATPase subunit
MITLDNITCGYGNKVILRNISASINKGEITCLLGKNGAGKTTLFKTILGILPALGGSILYDKKAFNAFNSRQFARYISYVPQAHGTPFSFTAFDVVLMGQYASSDNIWGKPGKKSTEIALDCIISLGINHLSNKPFSKLSAGENHIVLIARAMAQQPAFIAMDEPTANLDMSNQIIVLQLVNLLRNKGYGIIMNTHDPDHALNFADKVIMLQDGEIKACGEPKKVINSVSMSELYNTDIEIVSTYTQNGSCKTVCIHSI